MISSDPKSINAWALELKQRYNGRPVAVACELKKGPLIYALSKFKHIVLFVINPSSVAKYRAAFTHSGAKDDPTDAIIQVEILQLHMDKLTVIRPDSEDVRCLAQLVEYRRKLVQDRVDLTNKIATTLKNYYPHVIDWFKEKTLKYSVTSYCVGPLLLMLKKRENKHYSTSLINIIPAIHSLMKSG